MTIRALLFIDFCLKHLESLQSPLNQGLRMILDCNLTITPKSKSRTGSSTNSTTR